jgi:hypothetical protein
MLLAGTGLMLMLQPVPAAAPPAAPAPAATTAGRSSDTVLAVAAAALPPLDGEAFRFTDIGPDARDATIFEAHRTPAGITRSIIGLSRTQGGWEVVSRDTRRLAAETFDYLSARIATAIAAPPAPTAPCADGTDYLGELAKGGVVRSRGGCGENHPNVALARLFGVREKP